MSLKALIFDVDGTLADTEMNGHRVAYLPDLVAGWFEHIDKGDDSIDRH